MSRMSKQQAIDILQDFDPNYTVSVESIKYPELSDGNRYRLVAQANEKNEDGLLAVKTRYFKTGFELVHAAHYVLDFHLTSFDDLILTDGIDEYWETREKEQAREYFKQRATAAKEDK